MANLTDSACVSYLSTSEIVGLSFIAESGVISTVAVLIFAALVIRNVIEDRRNPGPQGPAPLIRTHVDGYMLSLMFADFLQGLGAITSAKWAADGKVTCSAYCTAQGALQQLGETGVALSTLAIAIHTFATVFLRWQPARVPWLWMIVVAFIWLFLLLFVVIAYGVHSKDTKQVNGEPYFGPTPFWCWIGPHYQLERIFGEYFWLWFAAFVNIVLYPFLFFVVRGNIDVDPTNWRRIRFHRRNRKGIFGNLPSPTQPRDTESVRMTKMRKREAYKMFAYPVSYIFLVLPLSVNRWASLSSSKETGIPVRDLSIVRTSIFLFIFGLSGLCNVLLFLFTRPNLLLFNVRRERKREKRRREQSELHSAVAFNRSVSYPRRRHSQAYSPNEMYVEEDDGDFDEEDDYPGARAPFPRFPPPAPLPPPQEEDGQQFCPTEKHIVFPDTFFEKEHSIELYRHSGEGSSTAEPVPLPSSPVDEISLTRAQEHLDDTERRMSHDPQLSPTGLSHSSSQRSIRWTSGLRRQPSAASSTHSSPAPPASIYNRVLPVQRPPVGYPSSDTTRRRLEEWAFPSNVAPPP